MTLPIARGCLSALLLLSVLGSCDSPTAPENPQMQTLTVAVSGSGEGTVTSEPTGIQCSGTGGACTASFPKGTAVKLLGTAGAGWSFTGWSDDCSGTGSCTVTLDANRTVSAAFGFGRASAIARARAALVDSLARDRFVLGLAPQQPLAIGTRIFQANAESGDPPVLTVARPAYFMFVDLVPTHRYGHAVRYLLVDVETGAITIKAATAAPKIETEVLYPTLFQRLSSADRFEPASDQELLKPVQPLSQLRAAPTLVAKGQRAVVRRMIGNGNTAEKTEEPCRKVAVTVASGPDREIKNDAKNMARMLGNLGFEVHEFDSGTHTLPQVQAGIRAAAQGLGPCDKFLLYISSHTQLVDDDNDNKPDGGRANRLDYGKGQPNFAHWALFARTGSLPDLIDDITAGTVNVVLDACYAQSLTEHMERPVGGGAFDPKPGVTINVFASSASDKTSEGASTLETIGDMLGVTTAGSTYTEQLVEKLEDATIDANGDGEVSVDEFETAFKKAHAELEGSLPQAPRSGTFTGPPPPTHKLTATRSGTGTGTVKSDPAGIDCGGDCEEVYLSGTRVVLLAIAGDFSLFREWSGDCSGSIAVAPSMPMDRDRTCNARFDLIPGYHRLSVVQVGGAFADGIVTSQPEGIACGQGTDSCAADFESGTEVKLTFTAGTGSGASASYDGGGTTDEQGNRGVTMDADREVQVTFYYQLFISTSGTGKGLVIDQPSGAAISCGDGGTRCTDTFQRGASISLEAKPSSGSVFSQWTGDCTGTNPVTSVAMNRLRSCNAEFVLEVAALPTLIPGVRSAGTQQPYRVSLLGNRLADLQSQLPMVAFGGGTALNVGKVVVHDLAASQIRLQRTPSLYTDQVVGARQGAGPAALLALGAGGYAMYTAASPFGETPTEGRTDIRVGDATHAGGGEASDAIVFTSRDLGIGFVRYDAELGRFAVSGEVLPKSDFVGDLLWAYIDNATGPVVVLSRSSQSRLYFHRRNGTAPTLVATGLGLVNNMRCLPPICIVFPASNVGVPVFLFDGQNTPTRAADAPLSFIPLEAALRRTTSGTVAALMVGRESGADRVAEVEFAANGSVVRVVPMARPSACSGVNGAAYVPDGGGVAAVVSCTGSHNFFIERSALFTVP